MTEHSPQNQGQSNMARVPAAVIQPHEREATRFEGRRTISDAWVLMTDLAVLLSWACEVMQTATSRGGRQQVISTTESVFSTWSSRRLRVIDERQSVAWLDRC
ncbi:hypothetical protein PR003_g23605 [Phytophthora rubi]|uniref:Uncharacterized protein n=1 Tax=Phytophthora rubi TaxID=129364 RepID=A0A6A3L4I2_9STRA|nr:hypothetical protein PR002_g14196 [Phytophthora rubi]KAE9297034.1 hypothetical protein PR003_g23605 [Phytophthora rubi]